MKNRTTAIVLLAVALAAVIFIVRRPPGQRADAWPQAIQDSVPADHGPGAQPAGQDPAGPADPATVAPATRTPAVSQTPGSPGGGQNPVPYPAGQPVVVGAKTFVPKQPPPPPDAQAGVELDKVRTMLRDYRTLYHENPVGTNAEIMQALMGGNSKQAQLGPPEGQALSPSGELVDRWGTPYFFHQLSSVSMEIRSAGPDKTLWTSDDLVTK